MQFHVVTDGHDQMEALLRALVDTLNAFGQPQPELVCTDNVPGDKAFFLRMLPSLLIMQAKLDGANPPPAPAPTGSLPLAHATLAQIGPVIKGTGRINTAVAALRDQLDALPKEQQVVGLDAEWDTTMSTHGFPVSSGKVALVQLGYDLQDGRGKKAMLLHLSGTAKLPDRLHSFLADSGYLFVGRAVAADIKRLAKDYGAATLVLHAKTLDLGLFARQRDVVKNGTAGLEKLVELTLGLRMSKEPAVRLSWWSRMPLSPAQQEYAALDAILSLMVHEALAKLPDLTTKLSALQAVIGAQADLVPLHGLVGVLATRAAVVTISAPNGAWSHPGCRSATYAYTCSCACAHIQGLPARVRAACCRQP
eukprot:scaffold123625_cov66-Phaeocystis_antarctica.AAC.2